MTDRASCRVEQHVRLPTRDETLLFEHRRRRWTAQHAHSVPHPRLEPFALLGVALGLFTFGFILQEPRLMVGGGTALVISVVWLARAIAARHAKVEALSGTWHAPSEGWKVLETEVRARSMVIAASPGATPAYWALFEVPGGEWYAVPHGVLMEHGVAEPGMHLTLSRLWPKGPWLEVRSEGPPLARHGLEPHLETAEVEQRFAWDPPSDDARLERGLVEEAALPAWIRAAVASAK